MNTNVTVDREALVRRGILLEYVTLGWNVIGVAVVVYAALQSNSVALAGFGMDSLIEIGASTVVIWELTDSAQSRRKSSLRLIGSAFLLLSIYILFQSVRALFGHTHPATSPLGMLWLAVTFVVMVGLAQGKRITGTALGDPVLVTEARVTMVDAYLAASVLFGLLLNTVLGWWWADPVAGLIIVGYGINEGLNALSEASGKPPISQRLKTVARNLKRELDVFQAVLRDPRTPRMAKILLGCAIGYVLLPFDIIPDFIPFLGQLDDLIIVPTLVILALRLIPPAVIEDCREQVNETSHPLTA